MATKLTVVMNNRYAAPYLAGGQVSVEGFELEFVPAPNISALFNEQLHHLRYDIVDLPLSNYLVARDLGKPITALPIFPTFFFPQLGPMVNRQAAIRSVDDLVGKRVGVSGFGFNPAAWLRGIFFHHYDLPVERMIWVEGEPNSMSGVPFPRSRRWTIQPAEGLMPMLERGEIDALIMADGGVEPTDRIDRLFPDYFAEVRRFTQETGVFPMNSVLTVKEATLAANPGLARALINAFQRAWDRYTAEAAGESQHMGLRLNTLREMGLFPPQQGLAPNRKALRLMVHYCYEQGLIRTLFEPEDLFTAA